MKHLHRYFPVIAAVAVAKSIGADPENLPAHFRNKPITWSSPKADSAGFRENEAIVRGATGSAQFLTANFDFRPLVVGQTLGSGSLILTGNGGQVDLFLGDNGPTVRVTERTLLTLTVLKVRDLAKEKEIVTLLNLQRGRILGNVKTRNASSIYEVVTPSGIAGIRGTRFDISVSEPVRLLHGVAYYYPGAFWWKPGSEQGRLSVIKPDAEMAGSSILDDFFGTKEKLPPRTVFLDQ